MVYSNCRRKVNERTDTQNSRLLSPPPRFQKRGCEPKPNHPNSPAHSKLCTFPTFLPGEKKRSFFWGEKGRRVRNGVVAPLAHTPPFLPPTLHFQCPIHARPLPSLFAPRLHTPTPNPHSSPPPLLHSWGLSVKKRESRNSFSLLLACHYEFSSLKRPPLNQTTTATTGPVLLFFQVPSGETVG